MSRPQRRLLDPIVLSLLLGCAAGIPALAEVHFSGTPDNVVLRANDASMAEILAGIRSTFHLRVDFAGATTQQFNGAYVGSLGRVLSRLLNGENFIISSVPGGLSIVVLALNGAAHVAAPIVPGKRAARAQPAMTDNAESNTVQGWEPHGNLFGNLVPAIHPVASVAPEIANADKPIRLAGGDDENNPIQGWEPHGNLFANTAPKVVQPVSSAVDAGTPRGDEETNNPVQGWEPHGNIFAHPAPAAKTPEPANVQAGADGAAAPQGDQAEANPDFQGWNSRNNIYRNATAKDLSSRHVSFGSSGAEEDESPAMQGFEPSANLKLPGAIGSVGRLPPLSGIPHGPSEQ